MHVGYQGTPLPPPPPGDIQMQVPPHLRLLSFTVACGGLRKEGRPLSSCPFLLLRPLKQSPFALSFGIVSALGFPYFTLFNLPLFQSVSDPHSTAHLKPHTLFFLQVSLFNPFLSIQNTQSLWLLQQNINLQLSIYEWKNDHTPGLHLEVPPSVLYIEG